MRSIAISVVGVAISTFSCIASSSSDGSRSSAGARNASPGTNSTTNSGVGSNSRQYSFAASPVTWSRMCRAWARMRSSMTSGSRDSAAAR